MFVVTGSAGDRGHAAAGCRQHDRKTVVSRELTAVWSGHGNFAFARNRAIPVVGVAAAKRGRGSHRVIVICASLASETCRFGIGPLLKADCSENLIANRAERLNRAFGVD